MATGLEEARKIIDETDGELTALFECRMGAVREIAEYKKENGIDIFPIYSWGGPKKDGDVKTWHHIDLIEENRVLLVESGIRPENIQVSGICTYEDERFFSARREGGECGRITTAIKLL